MFLFYYFIYLGRRSGDKKEENVLRVCTTTNTNVSSIPLQSQYKIVVVKFVHQVLIADHHNSYQH